MRLAVLLSTFDFVRLQSCILTMVGFKRLVRFEDPGGRIHQGEVPQDTPWDASLTGVEVKIYPADVKPWSEKLQLTEETAKIANVRLRPRKIAKEASSEKDMIGFEPNRGDTNRHWHWIELQAAR